MVSGTEVPSKFPVISTPFWVRANAEVRILSTVVVMHLLLDAP